MTTWFVTRHPGAREWAHRNGHGDVTMVEHFDPSVVKPGDSVLGTLPVHLAAKVCTQGGLFYFLQLDVPQHLRGRDLSAEEMEACQARLVGYRVEPFPP